MKTVVYLGTMYDDELGDTFPVKAFFNKENAQKWALGMEANDDHVNQYNVEEVEIDDEAF